MHLLFSVRVNAYLSQQRLFACLVELTAKPPPPVVEIQVESFVVRRSVRAVPRADHIIHIEGVAQTLCQPILCK